jgi:hypothetical protein
VRRQIWSAHEKILLQKWCTAGCLHMSHNTVHLRAGMRCLSPRYKPSCLLLLFCPRLFQSNFIHCVHTATTPWYLYLLPWSTYALLSPLKYDVHLNKGKGKDIPVTGRGKWRWGRFSQSTSVSPAKLHSTNFFTTTITYHQGLVQ